MGKVLGGNPFDPEEKPAEPAKAPPEPSKAAEPAAGEDDRTLPGKRTKKKKGEQAEPDAPPPGVEAGAVRRPPDGAPPPPSDADAAPDTVPPDEEWSEVFYGEEAAPAPGDYGPGLDKRTQIPYTRPITEEVREIERRVRARLSPAFPIAPRRKVPLEFIWRRYRDLAMRHRSDVVDEFGRDPLYAAKAEPLLEFLYTKYFRVDTQGWGNIPETGRALIVANHSGTLPYDGAMLMYAVRRETAGHRELRPLVEDFVFHFPYLGTFMNRIGGVRACQENAERLLDRGQLVAVFPEGIKGIGKLYKERYRLQRFGRGGFIKLALRTGAPIIPTAIIGAEEIHPMVAKVTWLAKSIGVPYIPVTPTFPLLGPLGVLPLPTKWFLRFGKPIDVARDYGPSATEDRILVNKLGETVRQSIQEMIDETLASRKSILFG